MFDYMNNLRQDISCDSYRKSVLNEIKKMKREENIETSA